MLRERQHRRTSYARFGSCTFLPSLFNVGKISNVAHSQVRN
jgi:hypothetical protein